jgi:CheY-like chemotaxis protein
MKKRILLLDDERDFTDMLGMILEADGYYQVAAENDGKRALVAAHEFAPDLIVLDVMMPDVDGTDVAERLRHDPCFAFTPIIFMTALATDQAVSRERGQTYLPKHVATDTLIDCIETNLAAATPPRMVSMGCLRHSA